MDKSRLQAAPGVWLDARRCAFLEEERVLAVSDLHLGYAWAHRFSGQLMPLQPDGVSERLGELCADYHPETIAILGDIVHQAVPVEEIRSELAELIGSLRERCGVKLILGNHDKGLARWMRDDRAEFSKVHRCGGSLLAHGNEAIALEGAERVIMGHEHPAISLGDGVRAAKFPCFLVAPDLVVLPAFSRWAGGAEVRSAAFMSPLARAAKFQKAIAILNGKLLPIPLGSEAKAG